MAIGVKVMKRPGAEVSYLRATLKGMNFNMGDVANALKLKAADTMFSGVQKVSEKAADTARTISGVAAGALDGGSAGCPGPGGPGRCAAVGPRQMDTRAGPPRSGCPA